MRQPVKFEFQMDNKLHFIVRIPHAKFGTYLYFRSIHYLKFKFNWTFYNLFGNSKYEPSKKV